MLLLIMLTPPLPLLLLHFGTSTAAKCKAEPDPPKGFPWVRLPERCPNNTPLSSKDLAAARFCYDQICHDTLGATWHSFTNDSNPKAAAVAASTRDIKDPPTGGFMAMCAVPDKEAEVWVVGSTSILPDDAAMGLPGPTRTKCAAGVFNSADGTVEPIEVPAPMSWAMLAEKHPAADVEYINALLLCTDCMNAACWEGWWDNPAGGKDNSGSGAPLPSDCGIKAKVPSIIGLPSRVLGTACRHYSLEQGTPTAGWAFNSAPGGASAFLSVAGCVGATDSGVRPWSKGYAFEVWCRR
jgi:hypothetical protein